jgi:methionyl-tRNA synthetase
MNIQCPCCENYTIDSDDEVIVEICEVCFWQYDVTAHKYPSKSIGPNKVSLNQARENYMKFGACREDVKEYVRKPTDDERSLTILRIV